jgi:hypothetical protein
VRLCQPEMEQAKDGGRFIQNCPTKL